MSDINKSNLNQTQNDNKKNKIILWVSISLIIVSVVVISIVLFLNWRPFQDPDSYGQINSEITTPHNIKQKSVNFLIAGIDEAEQRDTKLTDVIMLVNIDIQSKNINILQIPRDTYIDVSNSPTGKINAIYNSGINKKGIDGLSSTIFDQFSLNIDHYVTVTMDGFRQIIDSIGGVYMDVPTTFTLDGITINAGPQLLNGELAETFVRVRSIYDDADIGRVMAQRLFLASLSDKLFSLSTSDLIKLVPDISKYISTDLSIGEMLDYAKLSSDFSLDKIQIHLIPGEATVTSNGQSVYTVHKLEFANMLNSYFRPYSDAVPADSLKVVELQKTVDIYNNNEKNFSEILNPNSNNTSSE